MTTQFLVLPKTSLWPQQTQLFIAQKHHPSSAGRTFVIWSDCYDLLACPSSPLTWHRSLCSSNSFAKRHLRCHHRCRENSNSSPFTTSQPIQSRARLKGRSSRSLDWRFIQWVTHVVSPYDVQFIFPRATLHKFARRDISRNVERKNLRIYLGDCGASASGLLTAADHADGFARCSHAAQIN